VAHSTKNRFVQLAALAFLCHEEDIRRRSKAQVTVQRMIALTDYSGYYKPSPRLLRIHCYLRVISALVLLAAFCLCSDVLISAKHKDILLPTQTDTKYYVPEPIWNMVNVTFFRPNSQNPSNIIPDLTCATLERLACIPLHVS
jgi:hypothetical protein